MKLDGSIRIKKWWSGNNNNNKKNEYQINIDWVSSEIDWIVALILIKLSCPNRSNITATRCWRAWYGTHKSNINIAFVISAIERYNSLATVHSILMFGFRTKAIKWHTPTREMFNNKINYSKSLLIVCILVFAGATQQHASRKKKKKHKRLSVHSPGSHVCANAAQMNCDCLSWLSSKNSILAAISLVRAQQPPLSARQETNKPTSACT